MSRESLIIVIGLLVLFVPQFGVPTTWKQYILIASGVLLVLIGYSLRRSMYLRTIDRGNGERGNDAFMEQGGDSTYSTHDTSVKDPQ